MLVRSPAPALAQFVDHLWYVDEPLPPGRDRALPTGAAQIVVNLADDHLHWYDGARLDDEHATAGAGLCAALDRPIGVDTVDQAATAGVVFRPGGVAAFVDPPVHVLTDPVTGLDDLWGVDGACVRERVLTAAPAPAARLAVLERVLLDRLARAGRFAPDPGLGFAVGALARGAAVGSVVDRVGLSTSTFQRRFRGAVGLSPKRFARVRRLQRVLSERGADPVDVDWALVAATHGYADQAHLIHEFRALTGVTPGRYRPRSADALNHVPLTDFSNHRRADRATMVA
ncbi:helix-turn-helix transcriptional regulator [Jiangella asiatica]|uniref:AraC family transcriptional regulator n=1 Tax=Jiangella asiatica TaxID=2530372 RepID=A0A4R5D7W6_9ACTN|nr:helix-turn-helix transcriptional regulator [Jiangella asiatica]TDE09632.1 AraC family transcriptional regulator [Jiangella asiatica]